MQPYSFVSSVVQWLIPRASIREPAPVLATSSSWASPRAHCGFLCPGGSQPLSPPPHLVMGSFAQPCSHSCQLKGHFPVSSLGLLYSEPGADLLLPPDRDSDPLLLTGSQRSLPCLPPPVLVSEVDKRCQEHSGFFSMYKGSALHRASSQALPTQARPVTHSARGKQT